MIQFEKHERNCKEIPSGNHRDDLSETSAIALSVGSLYRSKSSLVLIFSSIEWP